MSLFSFGFGSHLSLRRSRRVTAVLVAATAATTLVGCSLLANLGQFDGATDGVDAADLADGDSSAAPVDAPTNDSGDAVSSSDSADATADAADQGVSSGNLIQNPGFEVGISPWSTFGDGTNVASITVSSAHAHSGTYSGWISNRTRTFEGASQDIRLAAVQGHTYTASAWALVGPPLDAGAADDSGVADGGLDDAAPPPSMEPVDMTAAFTCVVDGAAAVSYARVGGATATNLGWSQIVGTFTVPTCTMTALQVYLEGPEPGVDLFVDDVSVLP